MNPSVMQRTDAMNMVSKQMEHAYSIGDDVITNIHLNAVQELSGLLVAVVQLQRACKEVAR